MPRSPSTRRESPGDDGPELLASTSASEPERPPLLERLAVAYFRSRSASLPAIQATDAVHHLTEAEKRALSSIERMTVLRAFMIGAVAAALAGVFEVVVMPALGIRPGGTLSQKLAYWTALAGMGVITAVLEIGFLYWDALRSVHELARVAGVKMFQDPAQERATVTAALARAALEIPNSRRPTLGVDPQREIVKWRLLVATFAYKAKISASNFIMKTLIRRVLGRATVRAWLSFVAVPVTGAWTGFIAWKVMREARIRVMGPSAAEEICDLLLADASGLAPLARENLVAAVGASIVKTRDMHPNLECLLREAKRRVEIDSQAEVGDPDGFLRGLAALQPHEQLLSLQMLQVACVIDGRLASAERVLIGQAQHAVGLEVGFAAAEALRRAFVAGEAITLDRLQRVV